VNADAWLNTIFTPCLDRDSLAYTNDADLLRGQLRALRDCDVLSDQAYTDAEARLDAAVEAARERDRFVVHPAGTTQPPPQPTAVLHRVLAVGQPLAEVDGMPFILTSVELWSDRTHLTLAALPTPEADQRVTRDHAKINTWSQHHRAGRSGEGALGSPGLRGNRLHVLNIRLRDDMGNTYQPKGGSAGGDGTEWRLHAYCQPGIPQTATRLTVAVIDAQGQAITSLDVTLIDHP
jgi:hypothetical protein